MVRTYRFDHVVSTQICTECEEPIHGKMEWIGKYPFHPNCYETVQEELDRFFKNLDFDKLIDEVTNDVNETLETLEFEG